MSRTRPRPLTVCIVPFRFNRMANPALEGLSVRQAVEVFHESNLRPLPSSLGRAMILCYRKATTHNSFPNSQPNSHFPTTYPVVVGVRRHRADLDEPVNNQRLQPIARF